MDLPSARYHDPNISKNKTKRIEQRSGVIKMQATFSPLHWRPGLFELFLWYGMFYGGDDMA